MAPKSKKQLTVQKPTEIVPQNQPMSAESLIAQAIAKGTPVATLERLLAMRKELKAEHAKELFDQAMAAFQVECPVIQKTKEVKTNTDKLAYKFAPIDSIITQVKPFLQKHGFSYSSNMEVIENGTTKIKVSLRVTHSAGHSEITEMIVPLGTKTSVMSDTQVVAAAQTFARRYAFCNAFGILTSDEDNEALLKEKEEKSLPDQMVASINAAKSYEDLVAVCKALTDANPKLKPSIVIEYTRRKNELSDEMADQVDKGLEKGKDQNAGQ